MTPTAIARPLVLVFLFSACPALVRTEAVPKETGAVHIVVVDSPGGKLEGGEIKVFKNQQTGQDLATRFHVDRFLGKTATNIPYGRYTLRITQPGFPDAQRLVNVFQADVDVEVCVRTATVHIVDLGPLSTTPEEVEVKSFKSREDDLDLATSFDHNRAAEVPYGIYDMRLGRTFGEELERRVDVFQPEVWVVVDLEFSPISLPEYRAPRWVVTGTINNISDEYEPIYVSLVGIHVGFKIDDRVKVEGTSGSFTLAGFNPRGKFLLVISGQNGILDVREVDIPLDKPIVIDLQRRTDPR